MTARTPASRFIPAVLALLALGGCAPLEGDDELLLDDSEQALITEVTVPKLDGSSKDSGYVAKQQNDSSPSNFRLVIGDLPTGPVKKVDTFKFENKATSAGRTATQRTVELVLTDASVEEIAGWFDGEASSAFLSSFDDDGSAVMEMQLLGVRLIGRPKLVRSPGGAIAVALAYDSLSMATP